MRLQDFHCLSRIDVRHDGYNNDNYDTTQVDPDTATQHPI